MLLNHYLIPYLQLYEQVNLLGMGTLFKVPKEVTKEGQTVLPATYSYKLDELISENIDHFVMFIRQYENQDFEIIRQEIISDFQYCNSILNEDKSVVLDGIGMVRIFNKNVTLFPDEDLNKTFGYPTIELKP